MKFEIITDDGEMVAEQEEMQPAFVKGAVAAHEGRTEENPYRRNSFREAWDIGYQGVKQGKVIVKPQSVMKIACMYCQKDMGEKDGLGTEGETHSICEECWKERYPQWLYPSEKQ